jgi:hypothetical protein
MGRVLIAGAGLLAAVVAATSLTAAPADPAHDLAALLPAEVMGWVPIGPDAAYTPENLFQYLDGAAELYLSYGFLRSLSRRYEKSGEAGASFTVDVFDMGRAQDAFGAFSHSQESPTTAFGQGSEETGTLIVFWKGRHYVSILGDPDTPAVRMALPRFGEAIAAAIGESGPLPAVVAGLPVEGLLVASVRFFHHPIWLNTYVSIAEDNALGVDAGCEAVLARYRRAGATAVLLVIDYPDPGRAQTGERALRRLRFDPALGDVRKSGDGTWEACQRRHRRLAAVFGAPTGEDARALAADAVRTAED